MVERVFVNVPCSVSAFEAEEVGVEHLVREIKDLNMNSLKAKMANKLQTLQFLSKKIQGIERYIEDAIQGHIVPDQNIIMTMQRVLNLLGKTSDP